MKLDRYFREIESSAFQNQFSVLSGIEVVQFALSRDSTVNDLQAEIIEDPSLAEHLHDRILQLLPKIANEDRLSYDESIVAYLHSLQKTDLMLAHRASLSIWPTEGLLWSRWLAHKIIEFVRQIEDSVQISSVLDGPSEYTITDYSEQRKAAYYVFQLKPDAFVLRAKLSDKQLSFPQSTFDNFVKSEGYESIIAVATYQYSASPAQEVEIAVAD